MMPPLTLQWVGPILALATLATIGIGHGLVRRLHARFGTRPAVVLFLVGTIILLSSLAAEADWLSALLGITGITTLWDGVEIFRQEKRVKKASQATQT